MIYALLPDIPSGKPRRLPFYLAMEEYLARYFEGEYFFMWQVDPTVIFVTELVFIVAKAVEDVCMPTATT